MTSNSSSNSSNNSSCTVSTAPSSCNSKPNSASATSSNKNRSSSSRARTSPFSKQHAAIVAAAAASTSQGASKRSTQCTSSSPSNTNEELRNQARPIFEDVEYADEVVKHMREMEASTSPAVELMDAQPELEWYMRPYLVDFLIEVHHIFRLRAETLYLAMNIVDRYVSKRIVYKRHYQLVGCASLLIAAKFEDAKDLVPLIQDLAAVCCHAYDESAFTQMEGHVLSTIGWTLGFPTQEAWLRIACLQRRSPFSVQCVARFLMETTLFHRDFVDVAPSKIASGALLLAERICQVKASQLGEAIDAAQLIDLHVSENWQQLSSILMRKYSSHVFSSAATTVRDFYKAVTAEERATGVPHNLLLPVKHIGRGLGEFEDDDDDEDDLMSSGSATPSSMLSTPSRSFGGETDEEMPNTPLSLHSLHDPLIAAASGNAEKENLHVPMATSKSMQSTATIPSRKSSALPSTRTAMGSIETNTQSQ